MHPVPTGTRPTGQAGAAWLGPCVKEPPTRHAASIGIGDNCQHAVVVDPDAGERQRPRRLHWPPRGCSDPLR
jgi:hypothetical protein